MHAYSLNGKNSSYKFLSHTCSWLILGLDIFKYRFPLLEILSNNISAMSRSINTTFLKGWGAFSCIAQWTQVPLRGSREGCSSGAAWVLHHPSPSGSTQLWWNSGSPLLNPWNISMAPGSHFANLFLHKGNTVQTGFVNLDTHYNSVFAQ